MLVRLSSPRSIVCPRIRHLAFNRPNAHSIGFLASEGGKSLGDYAGCKFLFDARAFEDPSILGSPWPSTVDVHEDSITIADSLDVK